MIAGCPVHLCNTIQWRRLLLLNSYVMFFSLFHCFFATLQRRSMKNERGLRCEVLITHNSSAMLITFKYYIKHSHTASLTQKCLMPQLRQTHYE